MTGEFATNLLMIFMVAGSLFLALVTFIPRFPKMLAPIEHLPHFGG